MNKGKLSGFVGAWCNDFYGGPMVRELEPDGRIDLSAKMLLALIQIQVV